MECREIDFSFQSQGPTHGIKLLAFSKGIEISMATKIKGIFKGIKYISQIFVYKEHEMEIGYPTDVRHVAHIGWDGTSVNAPSWMNDFRTATDFSSSSLSNFGQSRDPNPMAFSSWSSQDFQQSIGLQTASAIFADSPNFELPKIPKKSKRKKSKGSSPPPSSSRSSRRSSKSKGSFEAVEGGTDNQFGLI